jgi:predicted HTH domain antitoxin
MQLILEDDLVNAARLTQEEARLAIAVSLFTQERLSLAYAARLAGLDRLTFQRYLAAHEIPLHFGDAELDADLATVQWLRDGGAATRDQV